jgi:EmrB/QacA subfamily drug resistance transporter
LVAFRALQAVGGSMLNPVALSIIFNTFTDKRARARAMGVWGSVFGLSLALGPVLGGVLVSGIGWRAIFWINVPVGLAAMVLTRFFVPESKAEHARRLDPLGQTLVIVALAALTYAIIEGPRRGWHSAVILGLFVLSVVTFVVLVRVELRRREPLIDPRFFRSPPFAGATLIALTAFAALGGFLFLNTLYLQDVRHYSALESGLLLLPMAATLFLFARISGHLVGTKGPRLPLVLSGAPLAVGAVLLARLSPTTSILYLVVAYVIFGAGCGLVNAPISTTAMSGMPLDQAGVAGAVASTGRQVGSSLGVAVTGSIVAFGTGATFVGASHAAWIVLAGCGAAVALVGFGSTGRWALATASLNGERLDRRAKEMAR